MIQKLKQKKGETLIETLVSVVIAVLSIGIIASCVLAATNINKQTKEAEAEYRQQLEEAEGHLKEDTNILNPQISIRFHSGLRASKTVDVTLYGGDTFVSYEK